MTARAPSTEAVTQARQVCACPVCLDVSGDWQCDNRDQIAVALQQAGERERKACAQLAREWSEGGLGARFTGCYTAHGEGQDCGSTEGIATAIEERGT